MPGPAALNPAETSSPHARADPDARLSLVDELLLVREHAAGKAIKIADVIGVLKHRGPAVVMLVLTLPFVIPVPLPGLSTPLGVAIMVYGFTVMLRVRPWVPGFIRNRSLPYGLLDRLVNMADGKGRKVERLLRPRLGFMLWPAIDVPIGLSLAFCGFFLGLPLPIPFTNAIPAVALLLLLLGVIERDGVFVLLGELLTLVILAACVYVGYVFWTYGVDRGWEFVRHGFHFPTTAPTTAPTTIPTSLPTTLP